MITTCDEASLICDKSQYNEATLWEKIKLNYHLLLCRKCKIYTIQNGIMTRIFKCKSEAEQQLDKRLSEEEKEKLKKELQHHL